MQSNIKIVLSNFKVLFKLSPLISHILTHHYTNSLTIYIHGYVNHSHRKIPLAWAQRKDKLVITLKIQDLLEHKIDLKPEGTLTVTGKDKTHEYALNITLYAEVNTANSKWNTLGRNIVLEITKKVSGPYWPRITKDDKKNQLVQIDWSRYVDEDEEDTKKMDDIGGYNMDQKLPECDSDDEEEMKEAKGMQLSSRFE